MGCLQLFRTTFHDFMLDVHSRLHRHERMQDPLSAVAAQLMAEFKVLCLDEFFVTDVADATMLNRLFSQMWDRGLVFVATSNRCSFLTSSSSSHISCVPCWSRSAVMMGTRDPSVPTDASRADKAPLAPWQDSG